MTGERAIRFLTAGVVVAVAAFAAIVSYSHIYDLARDHGQTGTAARLLPLSVDGLILAASLVLLHEARAGRSAPTLARFLLGLGVAATLLANVAYGVAYGLVGAAVSAWPALSFIGSVELVMLMIRRSRDSAAEPEPAPEPVRETVPADVEQAARVAYRATVAAGNPLSERQVADRFGMTRPQAKKIMASVAAGSNGHGPVDGLVPMTS